mgnify:FL=1
MPRRWYQFFKRQHRYQDLEPDEIFLDSSNLPSFDNQQFEGRLEQPIGKHSLFITLSFFALVGLVFTGRVFLLQVVKGADYAERSESNTLRYTPIYAERGIITDRQKTVLAWNNTGRVYLGEPGLAHVLGYVGYPTEKELKANPDYNPKQLIGQDGIEAYYNDRLGGIKGIRIEEIDALGQAVTDHVSREPVSGTNLALSIDSRVQTQMYKMIKSVATDRGFVGGSGAIIDVQTGEILALVSYPEFDSNILSVGKDREAISGYFDSQTHPLLNRVVAGLYTPGSVFKPFMAVGALEENIIDPAKQILSTGQISITNPYDPTQKTIFRDWKAHGWTDMRWALAVSSDVYFYEIGGGFGDQKGLGIIKIKKYAEMFGLSHPTGIDLFGEQSGSIPDPAWKKKNFNNEAWRLGDTYHTVIGQYGVQVTPLQIARGIAAIANGGFLVKPSLLYSPNHLPATSAFKLAVNPDHLRIVREGMRLGVREGTNKGLNSPAVEVAAKTGTAELGETRAKVNSWVTGFFPYQKPRYAFVLVLEKGSRNNLVGATFAMRQLLDWMAIYTPEYLKSSS